MFEDRHAIYSHRIGLLPAAFGVILAGLALRRYVYAIGLPFLVVGILPSRTIRGAVIIVCLAAIALELLRLVHFPALDAYRTTPAGVLLLGRGFSLWDVAC